MTSLIRSAAHRANGRVYKPTPNPDLPKPEDTHVVASPVGQAFAAAAEAMRVAKDANERAEKADTRAGYAIAVALIALFVASVAVISQWLI